MLRAALVATILSTWPVVAGAGPEMETIGGDLFVGGSGTAAGVDASRDLFAAGGSLTVSGEAAQDAHFAGFDLDIETNVTGDVYAAGGSVTVRGSVGEDLTAMGGSVRLSSEAQVEGNARLAGGTVIVDGPVAGTLIASGGEVIVNGTVSGDARIHAGRLEFGPDARIGGRLHYSAPDAVEVPESVVAAERVSFEQAEGFEHMDRARRIWEDEDLDIFPSAVTLFAGLLVTIGFFVVVGAIALGLAPDRIAALRRAAEDRPGKTVLAGVLALAMVFGLVPVSLMTVVGLPLVPVLILALIAIWMLGYALGVFVLSLRVWRGFGGTEPAVPGQLAVFAAGILIAALLNAVPVLGWILNFTLVLFGIGALLAPSMVWVFTRGASAPTP